MSLALLLVLNIAVNQPTGDVTISAADPGIGEAPEDGKLYGRKDGDWEEITSAPEPPGS